MMGTVMENQANLVALGLSPSIIFSDFKLTYLKQVQNTVSYATANTFEYQPAYRYGFNGHERDDDVKGTGMSIDYGFRIYDSRLAKFMSVDPLHYSFPWFSPYHFAGNTPIQALDLDGLEILGFNSQLIARVIKNPVSNGDSKYVLASVSRNGQNGRVDMLENLLTTAPDGQLRDAIVNFDLAKLNQPVPTQKQPVLKSNVSTHKTYGSYRDMKKAEEGDPTNNKLPSLQGARMAMAGEAALFAAEQLYKYSKMGGVHDDTDRNMSWDAISAAFYAVTVENASVQSVTENLGIAGDDWASQQFKADLVNYIVDGTLPPNVQLDNGEDYRSAVKGLGDEILKRQQLNSKKESAGEESWFEYLFWNLHAD